VQKKKNLFTEKVKNPARVHRVRKRGPNAGGKRSDLEVVPGNTGIREFALETRLGFDAESEGDSSRAALHARC
jgi:hypothetical protein